MSSPSVYERQGFGQGLELEGKVGLLIVDFVNGFADPQAFGGGNILEAIEQTRTVLADARAQNWPVAHSRIVFADDSADRNVFGLKVPGLVQLQEGNPASAIVDALKPAPGELLVRKTVPSAFFGTALAAWLAERAVQTLLIAGATTSGCVRASVVDAMSCGLRPFVLADCVGDRAKEPHDASLFDIQQKYGEVRPYADLRPLLLM
ncbi:N-carbamoylsarcosine amidase [Alcaligenes pakistanensis]|uniref:N-carbamoylsarcosine amidase n=1 Tax=Alcaligenes pakistanensis TaxID=1482717 RepID=A0A8H9INY2_9BURK|nr:isochorismatase family protein [Alcaligenes pakistanensis]MBP6620897.1 isochorismatase family protein [Alcaligenes sp.]GHC56256.1 N-carbamoylsarcosine amidase [Alcaligenes pakistanensis]